MAALEGHFGSEDAAHLRRRCRRVLTRISPDLLVQRARRAREECGLRRWADEPGVDKWVGTFPSEDAAAAWAAIDALAHQYRTQGACPTIERARAKALTDLVAGHATIDTILTVTIPATTLPDAVTAGETLAPQGLVPEPVVDPDTVEGDLPDAGPGPADPAGDGDLVEVTGPNGAQPVYVTRSWLTTTIRDGATVQVAPCHPTTGALLDDTTRTPPPTVQPTRPPSPPTKLTRRHSTAATAKLIRGTPATTTPAGRPRRPGHRECHRSPRHPDAGRPRRRRTRPRLRRHRCQATVDLTDQP